jgi:hypothetical protein
LPPDLDEETGNVHFHHDHEADNELPGEGYFFRPYEASSPVDDIRDLEELVSDNRSLVENEDEAYPRFDPDEVGSFYPANSGHQNSYYVREDYDSSFLPLAGRNSADEGQNKAFGSSDAGPNVQQEQREHDEIYFEQLGMGTDVDGAGPEHGQKDAGYQSEHRKYFDEHKHYSYDRHEDELGIEIDATGRGSEYGQEDLKDAVKYREEFNDSNAYSHHGYEEQLGDSFHISGRWPEHSHPFSKPDVEFQSELRSERAGYLDKISPHSDLEANEFRDEENLPENPENRDEFYSSIPNCGTAKYIRDTHAPHLIEENEMASDFEASGENRVANSQTGLQYSETEGGTEDRLDMGVNGSEQGNWFRGSRQKEIFHGSRREDDQGVEDSLPSDNDSFGKHMGVQGYQYGDLEANTEMNGGMENPGVGAYNYPFEDDGVEENYNIPEAERRNGYEIEEPRTDGYGSGTVEDGGDAEYENNYGESEEVENEGDGGSDDGGGDVGYDENFDRGGWDVESGGDTECEDDYGDDGDQSY